MRCTYSAVLTGAAGAAMPCILLYAACIDADKPADPAKLDSSLESYFSKTEKGKEKVC